MGDFYCSKVNNIKENFIKAESMRGFLNELDIFESVIEKDSYEELYVKSLIKAYMNVIQGYEQEELQGQLMRGSEDELRNIIYKAYNWMGIFYTYIKDGEKAITYFEKAVGFFRKLKKLALERNIEYSNSAFNNLAAVKLDNLNVQGENPKLIKAALKAVKEALNNNYKDFYSNFLLGSFYGFQCESNVINAGINGIEEFYIESIKTNRSATDAEEVESLYDKAYCSEEGSLDMLLKKRDFKAVQSRLVSLKKAANNPFLHFICGFIFYYLKEKNSINDNYLRGFEKAEVIREEDKTALNEIAEKFKTAEDMRKDDYFLAKYNAFKLEKTLNMYMEIIGEIEKLVHCRYIKGKEEALSSCEVEEVIKELNDKNIYKIFYYECLNNAGIVLEGMCEYKSAVKYFDRAAALITGNIGIKNMALNNKAKTLMEQGLFTEAVEILQEVKGNDERDYYAYFLLGMTCSLRGDNISSEKYYDKAFSFGSDILLQSVLIYTLLGTLELMLKYKGVDLRTGNYKFLEKYGKSLKERERILGILKKTEKPIETAKTLLSALFTGEEYTLQAHSIIYSIVKQLRLAEEENGELDYIANCIENDLKVKFNIYGREHLGIKEFALKENSVTKEFEIIKQIKSEISDINWDECAKCLWERVSDRYGVALNFSKTYYACLVMFQNMAEKYCNNELQEELLWNEAAQNVDYLINCIWDGHQEIIFSFYTIRIKSLQRLGEYEKALRCSEELVSISYNKINALEEKRRVLLSMGKLIEAQRVINKIRTICTEEICDTDLIISSYMLEAELHFYGYNNTALEALTKYNDKNNSHHVSNFLGQWYFKNGDYKRAKSEFKKAIDIAEQELKDKDGDYKKYLQLYSMNMLKVLYKEGWNAEDESKINYLLEKIDMDFFSNPKNERNIPIFINSLGTEEDSHIKCLYHYTSTEGLKGIISNQVFFASKSDFLNDSSELIYINEVLASAEKALGKNKKYEGELIDLVKKLVTISYEWGDELKYMVQLIKAHEENFVSCIKDTMSCVSCDFHNQGALDDFSAFKKELLQDYEDWTEAESCFSDLSCTNGRAKAYFIKSINTLLSEEDNENPEPGSLWIVLRHYSYIICKLYNVLYKGFKYSINDRDIKKLIATVNEIFYGIPEVYIISFSTQGDLLPLWTYYSKSDGYNMGLKPEALFNRLNMLEESGELFHKYYNGAVVYDKAAQTEIMEKELKIIEKQLHVAEFDEEIIINTINMLIDKIISYAAFFKEPSFKCEEEYRIAFFVTDRNKMSRNSRNPKIKFRTKDNMIIPYIDIDFKLGSDGDMTVMPLKSITIGPKNNSDIADSGLKYFLSNLGFKNVSIIKSKVPLRY